MSRAEFVEDSFESPKTTWILTSDAPRHLVVDHRRQATEVHTGQSAEYFQFDSSGRENAFGIIHELPGTPVFDELTASVWVKSSEPGIKASLRVRCPRAIDPKTGRAVVFRLVGDEYTEPRLWQQLTCVTSDDEVRRRKTLLRRKLIEDGASPDIDLSQMYVEAIELRLGLTPGATGLLIDDLRFGPLVSFGAAPDVTTSAVNRGPAPLDLSGGHVRVLGKPFVPRVAPYHGEPTELLRQLGFNTIWLEEDADPAVAGALRSSQLWIAGVPPMQTPVVGIRPQRAWRSESVPNAAVALTGSTETIDSVEQTSTVSVAPAPIGSGSEGVLFWMLGARIPESELPVLEEVTEAVRQSDRLFDRPRPVVADVLGDERRFSRRLDMTGSSVPMLHTATTPARYFAELVRRRMDTLPGSPKLTWIATEPSPAVRAALDEGDEPAVVEPEQILMQTELALAAGYKGVNFWTRTPFTDPGPGAEERRAAIEIANRRIALMQQWIATGEFVGFANVTVGETEATRCVQTPIVAPMFQSEYGILVRFVWRDSAGQHVPGSMVAANVRAIIKAGETPRAFIVSSTGIEPIEANVIAGGTEILLPTLDQSATVLITSYDALIEGVRQKLMTDRVPAAEAWLKMANAKLERVRRTHDLLQSRSRRPVTSGSTLLAEARMWANRAEDALTAQDYNAVRQHALRSMHFVRQLQRAHWDAAIRELPSPQSSIHTVCFSTLPNYWRDRGLFDRTLPSFEPVPGGQFADQNVMAAAGWMPSLPADQTLAGAVTTAESLSPDGVSLLMMAAEVEGADPLGVRATIETPPMDVGVGDLVELRARVRSLDGRKPGVLRLSDGRTGPVVGVYKTAPIGRWEPVTIIRKADSSRPTQFRMDLLGSGALFVDDVEVRVARAETPVPVDETPAALPEPRSNPLRILNPLELLPPLPEFKRPSLPKGRLPRWLREDEPGPAAPVEVSPTQDEPTLTTEATPVEDDSLLVLPTIRPGHGLLDESVPAGE